MTEKIRKLFHLVTPEEWQTLCDTNYTWDQLNEEYSQPEWCDYPHALSPLGCWSLTSLYVTGEDYCKDCDCYKPKSP